ncbi:MAG: DHH family phosphoesterase [Candidatus Micrarchaeota archaeon]
MILLEGVVSRVRFRHGRREYVVTDGKLEHEVRSDESMPQGACVSIEGEAAVGAIIAKKTAVLEGEADKKAFARVRENVRASAAFSDLPRLISDDITRKMWPSLRGAALEILLAKKAGRSVMLRFHGDADGISGAFAITSVLSCKAFQQNSAIYSVKDALRDMAAIGQESRPMVLLVDFGSADACAEGLALLAAAGIDYLVIDHHPYNAKGNARIVNPYAIGENASGYTAGYLACEIAAACGLDAEKAGELARVGCAGDKSGLFGSGPEDAEAAMVLDFLASHVSFGNNLDFYKKVMENRELFSSIARQADESIAEAAAKAEARMRKSEAGGVLVAVFSLEGIVKKGEWPSSSKVTTRVFDRLRAAAPEKPLMCVGHTEKMLIMRLNDAAVEMGLSANGIAEKLKKSMADFIEGGGGHDRAGAIRAKKGFVKDVLGQLLAEAGA